jgi:hypothetical protein
MVVYGASRCAGSWGKPAARGHEESKDDALQIVAERTGDFRLLNYSCFNRGGHVEVTQRSQREEKETLKGGLRCYLPS